MGVPFLWNVLQLWCTLCVCTRKGFWEIDGREVLANKLQLWNVKNTVEAWFDDTNKYYATNKTNLDFCCNKTEEVIFRAFWKIDTYYRCKWTCVNFLFNIIKKTLQDWLTWFGIIMTLFSHFLIDANHLSVPDVRMREITKLCSLIRVGLKGWKTKLNLNRTFFLSRVEMSKRWCATCADERHSKTQTEMKDFKTDSKSILKLTYKRYSCCCSL